MNKYFIRCLFIFNFIFLLGSLNIAFGQSKNELQQKKKQLQEEIKYTNKLLEETEKSKKTSLNQLKQLNSKIRSRENLIATMEQEIDFLEDSIQQQITKVALLEKDLSQLKEEYAKMIENAYKNRNSYNRIMFFLAASNFNQAYKRLKYFQQYAQYRQNQAEKILLQKEELDKQIKVLTAIKKSKEGLLQAKLNEKTLLAGEKNKQESTVNSLKGKEQQLKKELKQKQLAAQKISKAIEKIIAEEIRKAREEASKKGKSQEGFPMTPEAQLLSNSFTANKGKLPWPVSEGIITSRFGEQPHPTLKGVKLQNNGIEISTTKENMGRAIYEGTVSKVIVIPNDGKAVMINHGEYFSVYFYFKEVFVSAGEKVSTKQNIGVLMPDKDVNTSNLHLEIWKVTGKTPDKLNPELWIFKK